MGATFQPICDLVILIIFVMSTNYDIRHRICRVSVSLPSKYSSCNPFSKSFNLPSINFRNQTTHSYKTSGALTILCVLIFRPAFSSTTRDVGEGGIRNRMAVKAPQVYVYRVSVFVSAVDLLQ
jgi:hypothetical protein